MAEAALQFPGTMPQQGEVPGAQQPLELAGSTMPGAPVQTEGGRGGFLGKLFGKGEKGADAPAAQGISPMTLPGRPDIAAGMTDVAGKIGLNVEPVIGGAPRVTVPTPDSGMVIGADTPSNGIIVDEGAPKIIVKRPWEGGRRPSGAQAGEAATDSVSQMAAGQAEFASQDGRSGDVGLGNTVGSNESGDPAAAQSADEVVADDTNAAAGQGLENTGVTSGMSETAAVVGDAAITSGVEEVVRDESAEDPAQGDSGEPDMSGVGVPPPGEKYPNMAAPMTSVWSKPSAGEPSVTSDPDSGVAAPAPRELTQEEQDAREDREEAEADRQKLIDEGLGEDPAPTEGASGDTAPAIDSAASGDALAAQMRDQGVITGDGEDQIINATHIAAAPETPQAPEMTDEVVGQAEETVDASAPAEGMTADPVLDTAEEPVLPAEQPVVVGEEPAQAPAAEMVSNATVQDADDTSGQSEDGASDDDGDSGDAVSKDPYRAAMEKDPANDPAAILEDLHKNAAPSTVDNIGNVLSGIKETNQALQEETERLAEMPLRDAIQELRKKDETQTQQLITRLAWAHAFKNLEKQGITTLSAVEDTKKTIEEIRGMEELLKLFLEESGDHKGGWETTQGLTPQAEEPNDPSGATLIATAA